MHPFICVVKTELDPTFFLSRFLYDGTRIGEEETPASLDMEDNGTHPPFLLYLIFFTKDQ